jgi:cytochrome c-type biogenesis protein CcmH/NrfG
VEKDTRREQLMQPSSPTPEAWHYGAELLKAGDIDAGLAVLQNVVARKPDDLAERQALRELERKVRSEQKADEQSASAALTEVWWEIRQAKRKRAENLIDWDAIDRAAERGLAIDPWDVELHLELGHACRARGYPEVARFAYRCALEIAPHRADIEKYLAE